MKQILSQWVFPHEMPSLPAGDELLLPVGEHEGMAHRSLAHFNFWNYQEACNKIIRGAGTPLISESSAVKLKLHVLLCSVKTKQKNPTTLH